MVAAREEVRQDRTLFVRDHWVLRRRLSTLLPLRSARATAYRSQVGDVHAFWDKVHSGKAAVTGALP